MKRRAPDLVVADAGPLIGLAIIGGLPWIGKLFLEVLIPEAVAAELHFDSALPGATALALARRQGWLKRATVVTMRYRRAFIPASSCGLPYSLPMSLAAC